MPRLPRPLRPHRRLDEGLRAGDLEDLVLPLLSIDEFESKIDPKAVVVGFYVNDHDAAIDLNRFIQKSPVDIIDCDISPAPDQHGYYMVFVEVLRNARMADNIVAVVTEVASLTDIKHWKAQIRGSDGLVPFDKEAMDRLAPDNKETVGEGVLRFLTPSDLLDATLDGDDLLLEGGLGRWRGQVVGFGPLSETLRAHRLDQRPLALDFPDVVASTRLATLLGEGWSVCRIDGVDVLQCRNLPESVLLLRA